MLDGCESRLEVFPDISKANMDCDDVTAECRRRGVMSAVNPTEGINKTSGATTDGPKLSLTVSAGWLKVVVLAVFIAQVAAQTPDATVFFTLSVPEDPVTGWSGSSVILPCEVSPLFNAEPLEVRWYRPGNSSNPALFYKDYKIQETPADPRYKGRVSLTGGLQRGNVSLKLEGVTLADRGQYVCHVTSKRWYEKATVSLKVNVTGSAPVVSVAEGGGGQVNVTCVSEGWSPQPTLTWRNKAGTQIRPGGGVLNTTDPQGLVSVSSWLLYSPSDSDWLSCTVSLSEEERRESRVKPWISILPTAGPDSYTWSLVAFIVNLVLSLIILCGLASVVVILYKQRGFSTVCSTQKSKDSTGKIEMGSLRPPVSDQSELGQKPAETTTLLEVNSKKKLSVEEVDPEVKGTTDDNTVPSALHGATEVTTLDPETSQTNPAVSHDHMKTTTQRGYVSKETTNLLGEADTNQQNSSVKEQVHPEDLPSSSLGAVSGWNPFGWMFTASNPFSGQNWHQVKKKQVDVTMDVNTAPPGIIVCVGSVRYDNIIYEEDKTHPKRHPHVLSNERFRSGQHYWEVNVGSTREDKQSWYVGVARDTASTSWTVSLTPEHGFWILSYEKQTGLHAKTDPPTPVPGGEGLYVVGMFLDCDKHTLSFYNAGTQKQQKHLYTFAGVVATNYLQSVFSPGQIDSGNIFIISKNTYK